MGLFPVILEKGKGTKLYDIDGKEYIDFAAGFGALSLGHSHPKILQAIKKQGKLLIQGMGDVYPPQVRIELCQKLVLLAPKGLSKAVILTTGSDAVEMALKLASIFTGKPGILAFQGAYHGQSFGVLSVTPWPKMRAPFQNQIFNDVTFVPYPDPFVLYAAHKEAVASSQKFIPSPQKTMTSKKDAASHDILSFVLENIKKVLKTQATGKKPIGAVIVEPIQGRNGNLVPPKGFLRELRKICDDFEVLLIADEILTGFGRTGSLFAVNQEDVIPDLLITGKGLGGGLPIGAVIGKPEIMESWKPKCEDECHGSTFMGHPLSCRAALSVIDEIMSKNFVERSKKLGDFFLKELKKLQEQLKEQKINHKIYVQGNGLMIGIRCLNEDGKTPSPELANKVVKKGLEKGYIFLNGGQNGNILTLWPPLIITKKEIKQFISFLRLAFY